MCRFVGHVDSRYQRTFRDPPVVFWNSNWDAQKHVSVFEAMAMYEHLLNFDSVFCPIVLFGLEDVLFRITLSDQHHGFDVHHVSSLVLLCERFFGRHQ